MTNFTGKQSVNDAALGEFKELGFTLHEPDDHLSLLYFKDKVIATYCQSTLTIELLHKGCQNFLNNINRGLNDG